MSVDTDLISTKEDDEKTLTAVHITCFSDLDLAVDSLKSFGSIHQEWSAFTKGDLAVL